MKQLEEKISQQLERLCNDIEGMLNDFESGISDKEETTRNFVDYIGERASTAVTKALEEVKKVIIENVASNYRDCVEKDETFGLGEILTWIKESQLKGE